MKAQLDTSVRALGKDNKVHRTFICTAHRNKGLPSKQLVINFPLHSDKSLVVLVEGNAFEAIVTQRPLEMHAHIAPFICCEWVGIVDCKELCNKRLKLNRVALFTGDFRLQT